MESTTKAAPQQGEKLSPGDIISYGLGGAASTMPSQYKTSFAMNFMTDVAGLNITAVGALTMLLTIWDAFNDPIIGGIADRTNSKRWGKYRPHMMMGCICWAVIMMLLFLVPNLGDAGKLTYYVAILVLYSVFYTQFTVPWQALNSVMSTDVNQRNVLLTSRQFAGFVAGALVGIITMPIVNAFPDPRHGYMASTAVVSAVCVITGLLSAYGARKKDFYNSIPTPEKVHFKSQLRLVTRNRAIICVALLLGTVTLVNAMNSAIALYYLKYVVHNVWVLSIQSVLILLRSVIFIPLMPLVLRKLGKSRSLMLGMILNLCTSVCLLFLREGATPFAVVAMGFVSGAGFTIANVACLSMIPDCTDYTELNFGTCQAGFVNAVITFMKKFCESFSTMIVGGLLGLVGYAKGVEITPQMVDMIVDIKIWAPVALMVFTVILLKLYPITPAYGREMRAKLKESRAAKAAK